MTRGAEADGAVFVLGASSDIGRALVERYADDGRIVVGTYRNVEGVSGLTGRGRVRLVQCDVSRPEALRRAAAVYAKMNCPWSLLVSAVGTEEPIGRFFECGFDEWEQSVVVNSTAQLRVLHALYPLRRRGSPVHVAFFAGGGTNGPFTGYSAYCASKILLIKMCELLEDETPDLNVFILGPGWVRTKIHRQTLGQPERAGKNFLKTREFLESDRPGTSYNEIYDCLNWCIAQGREVAGGRNFSVVHDPWRGGGTWLRSVLKTDGDKFKLRRFRNTEEQGAGEAQGGVSNVSR